MRRAAKVDDNQSAIVGALRAVGASVQSLATVGAGTPDLLVGYRRQTYLLEVKDGAKCASDRKLTEPQQEWHRIWRGLPVAVVEDVDQALRAVGAVTTPRPLPISARCEHGTSLAVPCSECL